MATNMKGFEMEQQTIRWRPDGLVLALQFWSGDEAQALKLARLITDMEHARREDVQLWFCCDASTQQGDALMETVKYCEKKMSVNVFQARRTGAGYPSGANVLWASTMEFFYQQWAVGKLRFESVFTFEADGCPLTCDWIERLIDAHDTSLDEGKLITAAIQEGYAVTHPNGNLVLHVSVIRNYPELLDTPVNTAWDWHHHVTLQRISRGSNIIRSEHLSTNWSPESLASITRETAWMHGGKR